MHFEGNDAAASEKRLAAARGGMGVLKWFSTHPPTEERIARLRALS